MTCPNHPDRPPHAGGLCRKCYDQRRGKRNGPGEGRSAGGERPGVRIHGDSATVVSPAAPDLGDIDTLIRSRGLDPADWEVLSATLNEWDGPTATGKQTLRQLKIQLRRRTPLEWLFPATDVRQRAVPRLSTDPERPRTIALLPDPHCPYQDLELEKRVHDLLGHLAPDRVVCLGDVCDFPSISRHRDNPAWFASAQENIDEAFAWWSRLRDVAPDAEMDWIEGNHDARIRSELLQRAERMYGIKPASIPGEPTDHDALSLHRLCHLDRLHVNFVGPPLEGDNYHHAGVDLGAELHARHGFLVGSNSPEKTMNAIGMSVVYGHTHRQDMHHRTVYRGAKPVGRMVAVECGFLGRLEGGLGYAVNPRAQQGLAVATVWPDGGHDVELVPYDGRALRFRGRRF